VIIHPHITPGNLVVYSPPGRDDVQISVTVRAEEWRGETVIQFADGTIKAVDVERLAPMPAERMAPVASIRQVVKEFAKNGGDVSNWERLARKHGVGR